MPRAKTEAPTAGINGDIPDLLQKGTRLDGNLPTGASAKRADANMVSGAAQGDKQILSGGSIQLVLERIRRATR